MGGIIKKYNRNLNRKIPDISDELAEVYKLYIEVMENPSRAGWMALVNKIKPSGNKALINLKLLDKRDYIDWRIRKLINYIVALIKFE